MSLLISKMPRRRSERIRRMNEARGFSPVYRNVRGPPRRLRRARVVSGERHRGGGRERIHPRMHTEMTGIQNLFAWFLNNNSRNNNPDNNFLNYWHHINHNADETDEDRLLRVFEYLVNVALYECPSLEELFRANPEEGIRKFIRIVRYLFFHRTVMSQLIM